MIAQYRPKPVVQGEEAGGSRSHGKKHAAGGSGTDEHSVPNECRHAGNRDGQCPTEIAVGSGGHLSVVGKQAQEGIAPEGIGQGEEDRHQEAPHEEPPHRIAECRTVARSDVTPAHGLARIGKTVHHVREKGEELHQQGVDRQYDFSLSGTGRGKEQGDCYQAERAQKDVAVDGEEAPHRLAFPQSVATCIRATALSAGQILLQFAILAQP